MTTLSHVIHGASSCRHLCGFIWCSACENNLGLHRVCTTLPPTGIAACRSAARGRCLVKTPGQCWFRPCEHSICVSDECGCPNDGPPKCCQHVFVWRLASLVELLMVVWGCGVGGGGCKAHVCNVIWTPLRAMVHLRKAYPVYDVLFLTGRREPRCLCLGITITKLAQAEKGYRSRGPTTY